MSGTFDTVTCIDVMIHYPTDKMQAMVAHLASLSNDRLFVSFAPKVTRTAAVQIISALGAWLRFCLHLYASF